MSRRLWWSVSSARHRDASSIVSVSIDRCTSQSDVVIDLLCSVTHSMQLRPSLEASWCCHTSLSPPPPRPMLSSTLPFILRCNTSVCPWLVPRHSHLLHDVTWPINAVILYCQFQSYQFRLQQVRVSSSNTSRRTLLYLLDKDVPGVNVARKS